MQRDRLLLAEIMDAAERVIDIAAGRLAEDLAADRDRRDALLWNFTVLGEAIAQLSEATRSDHGEVRSVGLARATNDSFVKRWPASSCDDLHRPSPQFAVSLLEKFGATFDAYRVEPHFEQ